MKTLLSINNYNYLRGGAEYVFLKHNELFSENGWRVVPFAMQHPKNIDSPWSDFFTKEIEYSHHYEPHEKLLLISKAIYSFEARRKIAQMIDNSNPDIAHCHNIYHHLSPAILSVLKKRHVRTVMTLHDLKIACPAYTMLTHDGICERCKKNKIYNVLFHRCIKNNFALSVMVMLESGLHRLLKSYQTNIDRFIVPSRFYKRKLVQWGFKDNQFVHIPNFVELHNYRPKPIEKDTLLYFGRLAPPKGLKTLIRAAKQTDAHIMVAGTGPEEASLKQYAQQIGADVTFTGFLSGKKLHHAIRRAKATVLPSEWYENAPISILESYALGTAVIGANIGGIPELIKNGITGFIFESGNVADLADRIAEMMKLSQQAAVEMGQNGRRWIETDFTSTAYLKRVGNLYAELKN